MRLPGKSADVYIELIGSIKTVINVDSLVNFSDLEI